MKISELDCIMWTIFVMVGVSWIFTVIELTNGRMFMHPVYMFWVFLFAGLFYSSKTEIKIRQTKLDKYSTQQNTRSVKYD